MYALRFDMRNPFGRTDLYAAALDMAAFADAHGGRAVTLCEHHGSPDGYLPAPLTLAAAVAARTSRIPVTVAAVLAPLHQPVALAEQIAVLDILSGGRVSYVFGLGYRSDEFALYGVRKADRSARFDACVATVLAALRGEAVPGLDPSLRITPRPLTPGGPRIAVGGGTVAAVRRAARLGLGMVTETAGLADAYRKACAEVGVEPGLFVEAPPNPVTVAFVDPDPDRAWAALGPHLLHDASTYARWNAEAGKAIDTVSAAGSVAELRAAGHPYRVFTPAEAAEHIREHGALSLAPLCGGAPPVLGWSTLHAIVDDVLPRLT